MADATQPCRTCKCSQPLSLFIHQRFPQRSTTSCLDCRTGRRASTSALSPPSSSLPAPPPAPGLVPALPALTPLPAFVTHADFTTGLGELRQFLQDEIAHTVQGLAASVSLSPASHTPPASSAPVTTSAAPAAPALPACTADIVDKVHNDTLGIYELPKLANPSWPGISLPEDPASVIVEGVTVVKAPTVSTSNKQFLKSVPSFTTFGRLWVIYLTLRASSSPDRDLPVSLGRFFQHVADLQEVFPWSRVVDYVVAVCTSRLGKASSVEWARFDNELHATHFQGVPACHPTPATSLSTKRPAPHSDDPRREQVCISWNNGKCAGTDQHPCIRKHVCLVCAGSHTVKTCSHSATTSGSSAKVAKTD